MNRSFPNNPDRLSSANRVVRRIEINDHESSCNAVCFVISFSRYTFIFMYIALRNLPKLRAPELEIGRCKKHVKLCVSGAFEIPLSA